MLKLGKNWIIVIASFLVSFVILNRWVITPLHEKSFGRIWQYYVSWKYFGFHRRGIVGTFLTETGLNSILANEYYFAYIFYSLLLILLYAVSIVVLNKIPDVRSNSKLMIAYFFSPTLFLHFGYSTGNNDIILFILFLSALFIANRHWVFGLILAVGVLVHELFIFMLPAIYILKYLLISNNVGRWTKGDFFKASVWPVITIFMVMFFGKIAISRDVYESFMAFRMPNAAYHHDYWSGYFEVSSTTKANFNDAMALKEVLWDNLRHISLPILYAVLAAAFASFWLKRGFWRGAILFCSLLGPLAAQLVAGDLYRWVAMAGCVALTAVLVLWQIKLPRKDNWAVTLLTAFCVLAPLGSAGLDRPFPLHQFILEKLGF